MVNYQLLTILGVVLLRILTLPLSSYSQEYGFLEAYYSLLATSLKSDLQPRWWNTEIRNTPPMYIWILALWSKISITEFWLRLPSVISYVIASIPIYYLSGYSGVLLWLTFPLSFTLAGKTQPDMLFSSLIITIYYFAQKKNLAGFLIPLQFAIFIKPHALLALFSNLKWRQGITTGIFFMLGLGWILVKLEYSHNIISHIESRYPGYWGFIFLISVPIFYGAITILYSIYKTIFQNKIFLQNNLNLYGIIGLFMLFTLYSMPTFKPHEYYFLPILPFFAILTTKLAPQKIIYTLVGINLCFTIWTGFDNGDFWDTRTKDLSNKYELMSSQQGLNTVTSWYEKKQISNQTNGLMLTYEPICKVLEKKEPLITGDSILYVVDCG